MGPFASDGPCPLTIDHKSSDLTAEKIEVKPGHFAAAKFANSGLSAGTSKVDNCVEPEDVSESVPNPLDKTSAEFVAANSKETNRLAAGDHTEVEVLESEEFALVDKTSLHKDKHPDGGKKIGGSKGTMSSKRKTFVETFVEIVVETKKTVAEVPKHSDRNGAARTDHSTDLKMGEPRTNEPNMTFGLSVPHPRELSGTKHLEPSDKSTLSVSKR